MIYLSLSQFPHLTEDNALRHNALRKEPREGTFTLSVQLLALHPPGLWSSKKRHRFLFHNLHLKSFYLFINKYLSTQRSLFYPLSEHNLSIFLKLIFFLHEEHQIKISFIYLWHMYIFMWYLPW
jgi:hypothetical protein